MRKREAYLEHLAKTPMFSACSKKELQKLASLTDEVQYKPGDVLISEGTAGREFFVIIDGKATVTRNGKEVAVLGPGDFFGELALLDKSPRNATVTAKTDVDVMVLEERNFRGALAEAPTMTNKLAVGLARRLRELDSKV